jgi:hypothetical protein
MTIAIRSLRAALAGILILAASAVRAEAQASAPNDCRLEFTRANNMWGTPPDSYKSLGIESITLQPGQKKAFVTDWRFEKQRNDGTTYYGSHGRTHHNRGTRVIKITYKPTPVSISSFYLDPGQSTYTHVYVAQFVVGGRTGDIVEVACP